MSDLQLLRTFVSVYRNGSFTRAAKELHLTQPAVSGQIRALEQQYGKPLFIRAARGARPTSLAKELAQAATPHIDALDSLLDVSDPNQSSISEIVHVGGPEEFLNERILPELFELIDSGISVRMIYDVDEPIIDHLVSGEIDLAILTTPLSSPGIDTQPLCFETLELVASPEWAQKSEPIMEGPAGATQLSIAPIAAYSEQLPLVRTYWEHVFHESPRMSARFVGNGLRPCLQFALNHLGVTVLPAHTTARHISAGTLVRLVEPAQPPRTQLYLAWRAGGLRRTSLLEAQSRILHAARSWE